MSSLTSIKRSGKVGSPPQLLMAFMVTCFKSSKSTLSAHTGACIWILITGFL